MNFSKTHRQTFSKQNINLTCAVNTLKFIKTTWEKMEPINTDIDPAAWLFIYFFFSFAIWGFINKTIHPLVRLLRSAAPSHPKLASMATSRCTTPTPTSLAWVTPACGRSPSCLVPFTFSWLRWLCPSSLHWSHSVRGAERAWEGLLKHSSSECDSQQRLEMDPQPSDPILVSVWIDACHT